MDGADLGGEGLGEGVVGGEVGAGDADVDGDGRAHVEDGVDQAAGGEEGLELGHVGGDPALDLIDVLEAAGGVIGREGDLQEAGVDGGVGGEERGEAGIEADVGDDHAHVVLGDDAADHGFEAGGLLLGELELGAGGGFEVDDELAGIGAREVGEAEEGEDSEAEEEDDGEDAKGGTGPFEDALDEEIVADEEGFEEAVEGGVEAVAEAGFGSGGGGARSSSRGLRWARCAGS